MADDNLAPVEAKPKKDDADLLATARKRLKLGMEALSDSRESELDDLKFMAASPDDPYQWPADVLATRGSVTGETINARPCLTINKLPQHVLQVTNDQRQNRPAGKVIPVDDKADVKVAEIFDGIVRHIEYKSDADVAYDTACTNQVTYGEGYFRILTEYCSEMSFDQDIKIGRIRNSFSVHMDPTIQDPCGSDAKWCFISQDLTKEEFERQFPSATPVSSWQAQGIGDEGMSAWMSAETIRIAEYFYFENQEVTLNLYEGASEGVIAGSAKDTIFKLSGSRFIRDRKSTIKVVKWCKINGYEVLERRDWPGKHIPVIRVVGNEFEIEGQLYVSGIIRNAKDAQRMYNYWTSAEAEFGALAPKAPFIGYGGQFEGYEAQWKTANINNWPYLEVNPEITDHDGRVLPLPQRSTPPMLSSAILQAKLGAADDIKGTTGQYDPSLGDKSNETSGIAIRTREKQSDTGTYHYNDNFARAIRYGIRQIIELIPKIYDTQRIARIIGIDGEADHVHIDPSQDQPLKEIQQNDGAIKRIYNLSAGTYDVVATTGPSYMTKRQEAAEAQTQLLSANPDLWKIAGDLFVKNLDWPGADELAKRLAKTIPPELMDGDDESPELAQAKAAFQKQGQQVQMLTQMIKSIQDSFEAKKAETEAFTATIKAYEAQTKRITAFMDNQAQDRSQTLIEAQTAHQILTAPPLEQRQGPQ